MHHRYHITVNGVDSHLQFGWFEKVTRKKTMGKVKIISVAAVIVFTATTTQ